MDRKKFLQRTAFITEFTKKSPCFKRHFTLVDIVSVYFLVAIVLMNFLCNWSLSGAVFLAEVFARGVSQSLCSAQQEVC